MKLYLRPKGENGLPLHPTANIEECMKSYDKIVGELYTEEDMLRFAQIYAVNKLDKTHVEKYKKQTK